MNISENYVQSKNMEKFLQPGSIEESNSGRSANILKYYDKPLQYSR